MDPEKRSIDKAAQEMINRMAQAGQERSEEHTSELQSH